MNASPINPLITFLKLIKSGIATFFGRLTLSTKALWMRLVAYTGYFFVFILLYFLAVDINFLWLFGKSPSLLELKNPKPHIASELYSADGVLLGRYYSENRSPVTFKDIPQHLIDALICTEDVRFYEHHGVDFRALIAALYSTFKGDSRGGSTLTQQIAKNLYKTRTDVSRGLLGNLPLFGTIIGKSKEWVTAVKLESRFEKNELITLYLNTVDFGSNTFGIKTASRTFFDTTSLGLTIPEAATLVGLLKAPTAYSPLINPKQSQWRRNIVLAQMVKYGKLKQSDYDRLKQEPIKLRFHIEQPFEGQASYFRGVMNNYLKAWCKENGYDLYTSGLKIYTTIDSRMQALAEESVKKRMRSLQQTFDNHWQGQNPWVDEKNRELRGYIDSIVTKSAYYKVLMKRYNGNQTAVIKLLNTPKKMKVFVYPKSNKDSIYEAETLLSTVDSIKHYKRFLHGGLVAIHPKTGKVLAWAGGLDYKYFKYDHVMQSKRQPGSTFKAFVYATAFEKGYSPCDRVVNKPLTIRYTEKGEQKEWSPVNADRVFDYDSMTLRHAFAMSINVIAAAITEKVGWDEVVKIAHKCGIKSFIPSVPSVGLGSADVNLFELTSAYSTFINEGKYIEPSFITQIKNAEGKVIHTVNPKTIQAISQENAFLMVDMLKAGLDEGGTSSNLWSYDIFLNEPRKPRNEFGGKTGTSSNHSDGWFVSVSNGLVCGAWVGGEDRCIHFRTTELGEGAKTALPIVGIFLEKVYQRKDLDIERGPFPKPKTKISKNYGCHTAMKRKESDSTKVEEGTENTSE